MFAASLSKWFMQSPSQTLTSVSRKDYLSIYKEEFRLEFCTVPLPTHSLSATLIVIGLDQHAWLLHRQKERIVQLLFQVE